MSGRALRFAVRMSMRELRASWGRLVFFFLCVAIGVAAIVGLRSVMQSVRFALTHEARELVGADVVVQSTHPLTPAQRADVNDIAHPDGALELIETTTMASRVEDGKVAAARLVEIRAIDPGFPFYGTLQLASGRPFSQDLVAHGGMLVQPEVLAHLGVKVGDELRIGGRAFTIRDVVTRDRVQRSGFSLGPRVYVARADLEDSPILGFGGRANYQLLLKIGDPTSVEPIARQLRRRFRNDLISARSWRGVEDRLGRNLTLAENYLSLVGFAIVVLGGIGVWSVTRVFVQQKIKSVAVLKCLGASSAMVLWTYVLQVGWMALFGSAIGAVLAAAALSALPEKWLNALSVSTIHVTPSAIAQGVAVGVLVSLLFALVPLLEMRRVKPLLLLRADAAQPPRRRDWQTTLASAAIGAALVLVAIWQADSVRAGLYVCSGLAGVSLALVGVGRLLVRAVKPLARSRHFAIRHAVVSLGRPGNQTRVVLMAVGLGCFFTLAMRAMQANLMAEFDGQLGRAAPDLVLIDVQPAQVAGVTRAVSAYATRPPVFWPMMRARVVGVEGRRVQLPDAAAIRRQGRLTREFGITYRGELQDNEKLLAGTFWKGPLAGDRTPDGAADTEVSIEQMVHDDADVDVGDLVRFDIGGRAVRARVTSIRKVTWDEAQNGGFMFVLRPGQAVERAPHTFVGFAQVPPGAEAAAALERDVVRGFPNVSVIDVREVLAAIREVVDNATLGVTIVGAVTLFGGVLILIGAVAVTKFQRLYEAAIYRTLGASTRLLAAMTAIEYGVMGLLAGIIGGAGALVLSWAIATRLFEIAWHPAPGLLVAGVAGTAVIVCLVGLAASVDVLVRKPLTTLRRE